MHKADLCTEDEISDLVHAFPAAVREDDLPGPVFAERLQDRGLHLPKLNDATAVAPRAA